MTAPDRLRLEDVTPDSPLPEQPVARICVVASLSFPDISAEDSGLVRRFTSVTLSTLVGLGAAYELWDSSAPLASPRAAGDFDGLLLLGGGDIDASCYGSTAPNPTTYGRRWPRGP